MASTPRRKQKRRFEWSKISSVPEDEDTLEKKESGDSLTVHSASLRNR